jgi:hypothetical protein
MSSENQFSKDEIKKMTGKLSKIASAVTGQKINSEDWGGGSNLGLLSNEGESVMNLLTCPKGSACYKTKHNAELKRKFQERTDILNDAPIELSRAEKNYYVFNEGNPGGGNVYKNLIIDRFATTAHQFKTNSIDRQQQFMADLSQAIKQYQAETIFQAQSAKLLRMREDEQADLIKNINYYQKILQTSERKAVYENQNMDSLYMYRRLMMFTYYAAIVCFIIFANFIPDKLYMNYTVWLLIVIAAIFPIILNIMVKWIFIFYDIIGYYFEELPHKDVYYAMGNPANDKPPKPPGTMTNINPIATSAIPSSVLAALPGGI